MLCAATITRRRFNRKTFSLPSCYRNALSSSSSTISDTHLSWARYLEIRRGKRKWELAATIPSTLIAFGIGASYFGSLESDPTKTIFGVEPIYVYGVATLGCGGLGYLFGPVIGSTFWRMSHRRTVHLIDARDREFHRRISSRRVDPSRQSATNPVPDFYGEKIGSLHQYRQWLRDQAKYRKKAAWPEI